MSARAAVVDPEAVLAPEGFDEAQRDALASEISIFPARAFYPSSIGHPCDRFLVWNFTRWQTKARHDVVLQSIFDEGRLHQPSIYVRLEQMGFEVVRESDRPTQYKVGRAVISGRPDGRVIGFRGTKYKPPLILEAKSMSGYQWEAVSTAKDLLTSPSVWVRSYYAQGHMYALLESLPRILFVLKNKQTGMLKAILDELDYGYAEQILQRVERLHPMVERGIDPDPIPFDLGICGDCGWKGQCYPARSFGDGATVLDDAELIALLERREQLRPSSAEYERLDKAVKDRLKREGVKFAIVGPFIIDGKLIARKEYTVPASESVRYEIKRSLSSDAS
jgi:hypothetical protein